MNGIMKYGVLLKTNQPALRTAEIITYSDGDEKHGNWRCRGSNHVPLMHVKSSLPIELQPQLFERLN